MGRRARRRSLRGWGVFFGIVLTLALVAVVVEIVRAFWWAFLIAGTLVAVAWASKRRGGGTPLRATTVPERPARPPPSDAWSATAVVPTLRGELVRSRSEARIADLLHLRGIAYEYEPTISGFRPDFYVREWNLIIEYWGLDTAEYQERRALKTRSYFANGYKLVSLEPKNWPDLEKELLRKLYYFDRGIYGRAARA